MISDSGVTYSVDIHQGLPVLAAGEVLIDLLSRCVERDCVLHAAGHGPNLTYGSGVFGDPHRGEALFCDQQVDELAADEVLDLAADERDADLDGGLELKPRAVAGFAGASTAVPVNVAGAPGIAP